MARKSDNPERLIYCSGPTWEGNGSRESSPCQFGETLVTTVSRFKCHYCSVGLSPSSIHADKNGLKEKRKEPIMNEENTQNNSHDDKASEVEPEIVTSEKFSGFNQLLPKEKSKPKKSLPKKKRKKRRGW